MTSMLLLSLFALAVSDVSSCRATGSININVSHIQLLGNEWNSSTLQTLASNVAAPSDNANVGNLTGNRMFYANDYMV